MNRRLVALLTATALTITGVAPVATAETAGDACVLTPNTPHCLELNNQRLQARTDVKVAQSHIRSEATAIIACQKLKRFEELTNEYIGEKNSQAQANYKTCVQNAKAAFKEFAPVPETPQIQVPQHDKENQSGDDSSSDAGLLAFLIGFPLLIVGALGWAFYDRMINVYYPDCDTAWKMGAAAIHKGQPGYRPELDRDGNGIACEHPSL